MTAERVVSVVAVTYNSAADLPAYFEAIRRATPDGTALRVTVVDNDSGDGTVERVRELRPDAHVIRLPENRGYAAGINAALREWAGDGPVLVLNPHVRLRPGCVEELQASLGAGAGIAVPRLVGEAGELRHSLRREPSVPRAWGEAVLGGTRAGRHPHLGEVVHSDEDYEHPHDVDWATGAAMLVSADCVRAVGNWDESFFLYSEETDYALRARDAGFRIVYAPGAEAVHRDSGTTSEPRLWALQVVNKVRLFGRRHSPVSTAAFAAGVAVNEAVRAPRHPKHRAALRALVDPTRRGAAAAGPVPAADGVICFSALDWWYHNHAHADFQLMRRVAQSRRVLFVNSIGMRMPLPGRSTQPLRRIVRKVRSISRSLQAPVPDLPEFHVLSPAVLPFYGTPAIRWLNTRLVTWQVRRAARRLGLEMPTCLVTIPTAWTAARRLPVRSVIYNRSDKHSEFGETDQTFIRDLEEQMLRGADRVIYVSRALMEQEAALTAGRARFLDHGVDLDRFRTGLPESPDLTHLGRPRLGFFGGFDDYVIDFDLLERLAKSIPEAELVLVGDATCSMERLTSQPNVTWLGYRPYEQIPGLGAGFDVALMPWQRNGWIEACNPIKLKEYLALGLAVVSTDFPEVRHYEHVVRVADDHDSFVELVRLTMRDGGQGSPQSRREAVSGSTWERRAQELIDLCDETGATC